MADFIYVKTLGGHDFLINTDNVMSIEDTGTHRAITVAEINDGGNCYLETSDTMEELIAKLRNPLVRPMPIVTGDGWGKK